MTRTVPAALLTALGQAEFQPFYAVEALFVKYTTDSDGETTKSGILYDWPKLGS